MPRLLETLDTYVDNAKIEDLVDVEGQVESYDVQQHTASDEGVRECVHRHRRGHGLDRCLQLRLGFAVGNVLA